MDGALCALACASCARAADVFRVRAARDQRPVTTVREAAEQGRPTASILWRTLAIGACGALVVCVTPWGRRKTETLAHRVADRLYGEEGSVTQEVPEPRWGRGITLAIGLAFLACINGSIYLSHVGIIPAEYGQPVMALYGVPFLVAMGLSRKRTVFPVSLLWAGLIALHALLIVSGVPVVSEPQNARINMLVSALGFGFISLLIGHLYSRHALQRLKRLVRD